MRAEPQGFLTLRVAGGEGRDVAAPGAQKFQRHVAESADTDDGHAVRWLDAALHNGIKNRDAAAEQWPGFAGINAFGQRAAPGPLRPHARGESAVPADDGAFRLETEILIAGKALRTFAATAGEPAESHAVADFQALRVVAQRDDSTDDFVAGDERIRRHAPIVVEHREIAVADAAAFHGDFNLLAAELAGIVSKRLQRLFGAKCGEGFDIHLICLWFGNFSGCRG